MTKISAVSGKKVVFLLFIFAAILAGIVFLVGLNQKHKQEGSKENLISNQGGLIYSTPNDSNLKASPNP